jgi:hypothetical protein
MNFALQLQAPLSRTDRNPTPSQSAILEEMNFWRARLWVQGLNVRRRPVLCFRAATPNNHYPLTLNLCQDLTTPFNEVLHTDIPRY